MNIIRIFMCDRYFGSSARQIDSSVHRTSNFGSGAPSIPKRRGEPRCATPHHTLAALLTLALSFWCILAPQENPTVADNVEDIFIVLYSLFDPLPLDAL